LGGQLPSYYLDVPVGAIMAFAGSAAPTGFLMCDGTTYAISAYDSLFSIIGTIYGGDASHFKVPDMRQRFPLGKTSAGTGSTLGASGGSIDHTHTVSFGSGVPGGGANAYPLSTLVTTSANNPPFLTVNFIIKY
jgi:microcystin-dependent protein